MYVLFLPNLKPAEVKTSLSRTILDSADALDTSDNLFYFLTSIPKLTVDFTTVNGQLIMERRVAIKQLIAMAGGAMLIPSCVQDAKVLTVDLKNLEISQSHISLLAEIAETIIPKTET